MNSLKKLLTISAISFLSVSCIAPKEGVLTKTRSYIGKLENITPIDTKWYETEKSLVQTDSMSFIVRGIPDLNEGTFCYIKKREKELFEPYSNVFSFSPEGTKKTFEIYGRLREFN